jgi:hypothetical protein
LLVVLAAAQVKAVLQEVAGVAQVDTEPLLELLVVAQAQNPK